MHSRFATLLGLSLIIAIASNFVGGNPLDEADAFAEFEIRPPRDVSGFIGFKSVEEGCRVSGSFDTGLNTWDATVYHLKVNSPGPNGKELFDLTKVFHTIEITIPGSKPFEVVFTNTELNCSEVPEKDLILYVGSYEIGRTKIVKVI